LILLTWRWADHHSSGVLTRPLSSATATGWRGMMARALRKRQNASRRERVPILHCAGFAVLHNVSVMIRIAIGTGLYEMLQTFAKQRPARGSSSIHPPIYPRREVLKRRKHSAEGIQIPIAAEFLPRRGRILPATFLTFRQLQLAGSQPVRSITAGKKYHS
jgi:hypothetical protein